jgi:hypothetical protein
MITSLIAFALLAQQAASAPVKTSTEEEAVREFEATCVAGLYDFATLRAAASASPRSYVFHESRFTETWHVWESAYGSLGFLQGSAMTSDLIPKCDLMSYTRAAVDAHALEAALAAMANRHKGTRVAKGFWDYDLAWSWRDGAGRPQMVAVRFNSQAPRQITLHLLPIAQSQ